MYPLAISGWAAVSPLGIATEDFAAGVRAGARALTAMEAGDELPLPEGGIVPGFDIPAALGRKGTRSMDRATALAVVGVGGLLDNAASDVRSAADGPVGLVLGTNTGSAKSMMDFTHDSLVQEKPFYVDPARFPNTVMNRAAGQCAIWYQLRGPNATIAGGHATGLLVLQYAARLRGCGHAGAVLCGAVEEFSAQRAWLEFLASDTAATAAPLGEGCAVFLLESSAAARQHGRRVHAELLAVKVGVAGPDNPAARVLARCIRAVLAEVGTDERGFVAPAGYPDARGEAERTAIGDTLGGWQVLTPVVELIGDTSAVSASFQIAALLAEPRPARLAMVTAVDREGTAGCALLRMA
jgi:3-oxoacyl-[acyl-carrier-protein] synthase II